MTRKIHEENTEVAVQFWQEILDTLVQDYEIAENINFEWFFECLRELLQNEYSD